MSLSFYLIVMFWWRPWRASCDYGHASWASTGTTRCSPGAQCAGRDRLSTLADLIWQPISPMHVVHDPQFHRCHHDRQFGELGQATALQICSSIWWWVESWDSWKPTLNMRAYRPDYTGMVASVWMPTKVPRNAPMHSVWFGRTISPWWSTMTAPRTLLRWSKPPWPSPSSALPNMAYSWTLTGVRPSYCCSCDNQALGSWREISSKLRSPPCISNHMDLAASKCASLITTNTWVAPYMLPEVCARNYVSGSERPTLPSTSTEGPSTTTEPCNSRSGSRSSELVFSVSCTGTAALGHPYVQQTWNTSVVQLQDFCEDFFYSPKLHMMNSFIGPQEALRNCRRFGAHIAHPPLQTWLLWSSHETRTRCPLGPACNRQDLVPTDPRGHVLVHRELPEPHLSDGPERRKWWTDSCERHSARANGSFPWTWLAGLTPLLSAWRASPMIGYVPNSWLEPTKANLRSSSTSSYWCRQVRYATRSWLWPGYYTASVCSPLQRPQTAWWLTARHRKHRLGWSMDPRGHFIWRGAW